MLVVLKHHLRNRPREIHVPEDLVADLGVGADQGELDLGQGAGVAQDLGRHVDLADIVDGRGQADPVDLLVGHAESGGEVGREIGHAALVARGVWVAFLDRGRDRLDGVLHALVQAQQVAPALLLEPDLLADVAQRAVPDRTPQFAGRADGIEQQVAQAAVGAAPAQRKVHTTPRGAGQQGLQQAPAPGFIEPREQQRRIRDQGLGLEPQRGACAAARVAEHPAPIVLDELEEQLGHVVRHAQETMLGGDAIERGLDQARQREIQVQRVARQRRGCPDAPR